MKQADTVAVAVVGATGYTGMELLRLLDGHPRARLVAATSRQAAGQSVAAAMPGLASIDLTLVDADAQALRAVGAEVVFVGLPHGAFASQAQSYLDAGLRVIDLSADFRLHRPADYPRYYAYEHPAPRLLDQAQHLAQSLISYPSSRPKKAVRTLEA